VRRVERGRLLALDVADELVLTAAVDDARTGGRRGRTSDG
jgi:hypothetical protein